MNNNSILDFYDNESKMLCRINKEGDKLIVAEWHSKEEKWVPKKFNQPFQMICITLLKSRAISGQNEEKLNENSEVEKKECENTGEKTLNNQEAISLSGIIVKLKEKLSLQSLLVIIKGHYYIYIGTKEKPENTFLYQYLKSDQEQGQWQWINTLSNNELNLKKIEEKAKEKWAQYIEAPYEEIEKFYFKPIYFVEKGHFKLKPDNIYLMSTTIKSEDSKVMYLFTTLTSAIEENRFEAKFSPEETVNNNKKMQWGWREENILALPSLYVLKAERIKKDLPISFKKDYILIVLVQYNGKNYIAINGKQIIEPKENNLYLSFDINSKLIIEKNNLTLNALENIIRDFECRHENDYNNYLKSIDNNLLSKIVSELKPLCSYDALSDDQDDSNIKCLVFLAYLCHLLDYMLQNEGNKLSNPLSHDYLYEQKEDKKDNNVFYFLNLVTNSQMKLDVLKLEFSINQQFRLYKMDLPSVCYQSNFKLFWEKTNIISYLDGLLAISLLYMDGNYSNQPMSVIGFPCYVQYRFDYLQLSLKENDGYIICFLLFYRLEEERQPYLAIETKRMNNEEYKKESHLFLFYDYISRKFKILTKENSLHQDLTNYMCNAYNYGERFIENPFLKGGPLSLLKKLMQANNLNGNLTKSEKNSLKSIRFLNIVPIEKMKPGKENPHSLFAYDLLKLRFSNNRKSWILKTAVVSYDTVLSWNPIEISDYLKIATPGLKGIPSLLEVNVFQGLPLSLKESGLINGFVLCLIIFLKKDVYFAIPVQRLNTISENSSNYLFLSFQNNALELSNIGTLTKLRLTNYATAITYTYKFLRPTNFKPIEIEKASNEFSKIIYPNQYDFKKVEEPIQSNQNNTDLLKIKKEDAKGFEIGSIDCSEKEKAFEIIEKKYVNKEKNKYK